MGSSFLTAVDLFLGIYGLVVFFKMLVQFGVPNHPARFVLYMVCLSVTSYFLMKSLTEFQLLDPFLFMRWKSLPMVAGGLGLLLQVITTVGHFSLIQQKIISRIPLISALLCFAFFPDLSHYFLMGCILVSVLFLTVSVRMARYQARTLFKMGLFLGIFQILLWVNTYWAFLVAELLLFPAMFYLFIFQQSYGVSALIDQHLTFDEGASE